MGIRQTVSKLLGRRPLFQAFELETSSPCNLRCETCPNKANPRDRKELPTPIIESLILQLAELGYEGVFSPHFYNEPLLDKRLPDILHMIRHKLPKVRVNLFTNFTLMTPELYRSLHTLVDEFIVTIDQPEVQRAVEKVSPMLSDDEKAKLRLRSLQNCGLSNRAGAFEAAPTSRRMEDCTLVQNMTVDAWGDVHLCCNDYFGKATFGNIKNRSLADIWFDPRYVNARELGARGKHPLCTSCYWTT